MTTRQIIARLLDCDSNIDDKVRVRVVYRDKHNCVVREQRLPITYISHCLCEPGQPDEICIIAEGGTP